MEKNKKGFKGIKLFLYYFIFNLFVCLVIYTGPGIHYAVNDDIAMRDIASGFRSGTADGHLVYIKYPLGWFISRLYMLISKNIDWYGLFLLCSLILSVTVILYSIHCNVIDKKLRLFLVLLNILLAMRHIFFFQWTVCAAFCGIAGVTLNCSVVCVNRKHKTIQKLVTIFLLLLCYMIRHKVFFLVISLALPAFVYKEWIGNLKQGFKKTFLWLSIIAISVICVEAVHMWAYSSAEWKEYIEFNKARSLLYDYSTIPDYSINQDFYMDLGVSENTYNNLKKYSYLYDTSIDSILLRKIVTYSSNQEGISLKDKVKKTFSRIKDICITSQYRLINVGILLSFLVCMLWAIKRKRRRLVVLTGCEACIWLLLLFYLVFKGRYPEHIAYTMAILFILQIQAIFISQIGECNVNRWIIIAVMVVASVSIFMFRNLCSKSQEIEIKNSSYVLIKEYMANYPENLYLLPSVTFAKYTDDFKIVKQEFSGHISTTGGWVCRSPVIQDQLDRQNIKEIPRDFLDNDNVFILNWEGDSLDYVIDSLSEICKKRVEYKIMDVIVVPEGNMNVYGLYLK